MDLTYFNPNSQKEPDFILGFVARQRPLAFFLKQLHLVPDTGAARQYLIVAPRGFGKTSLLRRVAIGVRSDDQLHSRFIALRFREEQHNVISLDVFWRNCLQSLTEAREDEEAPPEEIDALDAAWLSLAPRQSLSQDQQDGEPAWQALRFHCERLGRRPLLLIDNLDTLLAGLSDQHQWGLRKCLQSENGPVLIAAASRYPAATHDHGAAFYEFFRIQPLDKLEDQEVFTCLRNLALHRGVAGQQVLKLLEKDPGRVGALNTLAGGNPRTLSVLYGVLESHMSADVLSQLSAMLDTFTGWYQARTEELPMQARAVFDALALNWDPMTAAALGQATGLDTPAVSSQLSRLEKAGYAEAVALSKRGKGRKGYQVSERFFNIWYLMRNGPRRARHSIRFLTTFLQSCFSSAERRSLAITILENGRSDPGYALALASCLKAGRLRQRLLDQAYTRSNEIGLTEEYGPLIDGLRKEGYRLSQTDQADSTALYTDEKILGSDAIVAGPNATGEHETHVQTARSLVNQGNSLLRLGKKEEAIFVFDQVVSTYGGTKEPTLLEAVVRALVSKGSLLIELGQEESAITIYNDAIARSGSGTDLATLDLIARATYNRGLALGKLERFDEEVASYDEIVANEANLIAPGLREFVARAIISKAITLGEMGRRQQEVAAYDDAIALCERFDDPRMLNQLAHALFNKAFAFGKLGDRKKELAGYDQIIDRWSKESASGLSDYVIRALFNKAFVLGSFGEPFKEISTYEQIISFYGEGSVPGLQEHVVRALAAKAMTLGKIGRSAEEITVYDEIIERYGNSTHSVIRAHIAAVLFNKAMTLGELGKAEEELLTYDEAITYGLASEAPLLEHAARAMVSKGIALGKISRLEESINAFEDVVTRYGTATALELREHVSTALFNKAVTLCDLDQRPAGIQVYDELITRYCTAAEIELQEKVAKALISKAVALGEIGEPEREIRVYDEVLQRYGTSHAEVLRARAAEALLYKAFTFDELAQPERAVRVYDELAFRYSGDIGLELREYVAKAIFHKADAIGKLGDSKQGITTYDELIERYRAAPEDQLRLIVGAAIHRKAVLLRDMGRLDEAELTYRHAIEQKPDSAELYIGLGNLFLDFMGDPARALDSYTDGLAIVKDQGPATILHANIAYTAALYSGDRLLAKTHAEKALNDGVSLSVAGRELVKALPIWNNSTTCDWPSLFQQIGNAMASDDPFLWTDFEDDLQRLMWFVLTSKKGTAFKVWMTDHGFPERYAPLFHAFVGALEGEDHLLSINPETRRPAMRIYNELTRRLKLGLSSTDSLYIE